jgi:hypothetical protein
LGTGESIFGSKAAGRLCLVLWIRISRAVPLLPHMHSWHAWRQILPFAVMHAHFSCSCFPFYSEISIWWILGKRFFFFFLSTRRFC